MPHAGYDEILRRLLEDWAPLLAIGGEQRAAAPPLQAGRELPAEVGRILEPVVDAVAAVGRVAVSGIAGDEHAADLIALGDRHAHVPVADVVVFGLKLQSDDLLDQGMDVVGLAIDLVGHRRVEEPALADVDAAEELPVALELRRQHPVGRAYREATAERLVQLARAKYGEHHELVVVVAAPLDADLLAHDGMAAVAADRVVALQHLPTRPAFLRNGYADAVRVLGDRRGGPAKPGLDSRQLRHASAQHALHLVL